MYDEISLVGMLLLGAAIGFIGTIAYAAVEYESAMQKCQRENNVYECEYVKGYWKVK